MSEVFVKPEVPRAHGWAVQLEEPPAFEDAVDDRLGEVGIAARSRAISAPSMPRQ